MNAQRMFLGCYRLLVLLYPPAFRKRFGPEILAVAEEARPAEWPLIFGDTSASIARCWMEGSRSTGAVVEANPYMPLGGYPARASGFLHGFVLSTAIILALAYVGNRWPPPCSGNSPVLTHLVGPPLNNDHAAPAAEQRTKAKLPRIATN